MKINKITSVFFGLMMVAAISCSSKSDTTSDQAAISPSTETASTTTAPEQRVASANLGSSSTGMSR